MDPITFQHIALAWTAAIVAVALAVIAAGGSIYAAFKATLTQQRLADASKNRDQQIAALTTAHQTNADDIKALMLAASPAPAVVAVPAPPPVPAPAAPLPAAPPPPQVNVTITGADSLDAKTLAAAHVALDAQAALADGADAMPAPLPRQVPDAGAATLATDGSQE